MSLEVIPFTLPHAKSCARAWDAAEMREALRDHMAPFPSSLNLSMLTDVCMYNEEGHSLGRTIQSLALQQEDWIKYQAIHTSKDDSNDRQMQYMHAWIIADGWRRYPVAEKPKKKRTVPLSTHTAPPETLSTNENRPFGSASDNGSAGSDDLSIEIVSPSRDASEHTRLLVSETRLLHSAAQAAAAIPSRILSESSVELLSKLFQGDMEDAGMELEVQLEKAFDLNGAEYVLLQYVHDGQLAPLLVPCYDCIHSVSRQGAHLDDAVDDQEEEVSFPLFLSVLIKRRNAKKHDSHAIFYEAICKEYTRQALHQESIVYFFSTDVGTLYAPNMLPKLTNHLDKNANCAGCCAHQRIMSYVDQAVPGTIIAETAFAGFLRSVQAFDFESGLAIFNGLHASMQFLPVLPGPCSLFRACVITDSMLSDQRAIVTSPDHEDGLISGNLKIAEDRIPSYLVLLQEGLPTETHWVPEAVFFFESEDTLDEFIPQRRRWLNGTVAGYAWLVSHHRLISAMMQLRLMGWKVFGLCIIQLVIFLFLFSMPGQLLITADISILAGFALLEGIGYDPAPAWVSYTLAAIFWLLYVGSLVTLTAAARWSRKPVIHWLWYLRIGLNAFMMLVNTFVMIAVVAISYSGHTSGFDPAILKLVRVAATGVLLYLITPLLLTLMHSLDSFQAMLGSFFQFYIFLPTILSDFFAYSIAKLDDWSWGTKTAGNYAVGAASVGDARLRRATHDRLSCRTTALVTAQMVLMMVVSAGFLALKSTYSMYLVLPGLLPAVISLSIMSGSFTYYFQRAVKSLFACDRVTGSTAASIAAATLRIALFFAWICVVVIYVWFVLHSYLNVDSPFVESLLPDDPLYVIVLLVGALAALTAIHRLYRYSQEPARPEQPGIVRKTRLQSFFTYMLACLCVIGSVTMLTIVFLVFINSVVRSLRWMRDALVRLCACRGHQSDTASDSSVEVPVAPARVSKSTGPPTRLV